MLLKSSHSYVAFNYLCFIFHTLHKVDEAKQAFSENQIHILDPYIPYSQQVTTTFAEHFFYCLHD